MSRIRRTRRKKNSRNNGRHRRSMKGGSPEKDAIKVILGITSDTPDDYYPRISDVTDYYIKLMYVYKNVWSHLNTKQKTDLENEFTSGKSFFRSRGPVRTILYASLIDDLRNLDNMARKLHRKPLLTDFYGEPLNVHGETCSAFGFDSVSIDSFSSEIIRDSIIDQQNNEYNEEEFYNKINQALGIDSETPDSYDPKEIDTLIQYYQRLINIYTTLWSNLNYSQQQMLIKKLKIISPFRPGRKRLYDILIDELHALDRMKQQIGRKPRLSDFNGDVLVANYPSIGQNVTCGNFGFELVDIKSDKVHKEDITGFLNKKKAFEEAMINAPSKPLPPLPTSIVKLGGSKSRRHRSHRSHRRGANKKSRKGCKSRRRRHHMGRR